MIDSATSKPATTTSALTTSTYSTSPSHCWGEAYTLDAWANLNSIAATTNPNYTGCSQESGFSRTADGNNHLSGFSYDASGNTSSDTVNSYTWNGESQLIFSAGVNYLYDGDGRRVAKVGSKLYWYGSGDDILAETDASGNTTAEYIFFGGKRIAMLPAGGNPTYYVEDMLGTSRVLTTNAGVVCYDADFYPYGGERSYTNTCPQNYKFEGKERDTETGNDDFGARYYSNRFGRWLSADWSAVPEAVPYANLSNPQTLNLYSMVSDDPESFADLDGHCPICPVIEEVAENPEVQQVADHVIGIIVGAVTGFLASQVPSNGNSGSTAVTEPGGYVLGEYLARKNGLETTPIANEKPGTLGKPDHQQTVKEEAEKMGGKPEVTVETPGGEKGSRRIDAAKKDANGNVTEATQVIRPNKNGTPPAREVRAARDIEKATGVKPKFVPVRPVPTPSQGPKLIGGEPAPAPPTVKGPNGRPHHTGGPS